MVLFLMLKKRTIEYRNFVSQQLAGNLGSDRFGKTGLMMNHSADKQSPVEAGIRKGEPEAPSVDPSNQDLLPLEVGETRRLLCLTLNATGFLLALLHLFCFFAIALCDRCFACSSDNDLPELCKVKRS